MRDNTRASVWCSHRILFCVAWVGLACLLFVLPGQLLSYLASCCSLTFHLCFVCVSGVAMPNSFSLSWGIISGETGCEAYLQTHVWRRKSSFVLHFRQPPPNRVKIVS